MHHHSQPANTCIYLKQIFVGFISVGSANTFEIVFWNAVGGGIKQICNLLKVSLGAFKNALSIKCIMCEEQQTWAPMPEATTQVCPSFRNKYKDTLWSSQMQTVREKQVGDYLALSSLSSSDSVPVFTSSKFTLFGWMASMMSRTGRLVPIDLS